MKILAVISSVGLTEKILKNDRICSRHYPSGQPADLMDDTNPDWLPFLHLGHQMSGAAISTTKGRYERRKAREVILEANKCEVTHSQDVQISLNNVSETVCNAAVPDPNSRSVMCTNLSTATTDSSTQTIEASKVGKVGIEVSTRQMVQMTFSR